MDNLREFFDKIKDSVEIVWPLETMDYGQTELGIRGCDGCNGHSRLCGGPGR
jgi:hypothetical protein